MLENVIGILSCITLFSFVFIASFINMEDWLRIVLIVIGFIIGVIGILVALKLEQTAGYYECSNCGHKFVPTFIDVLFAVHIGKDRYLDCPNCKNKAWHNKVISK